MLTRWLAAASAAAAPAAAARSEDLGAFEPIYALAAVVGRKPPSQWGELELAQVRRPGPADCWCVGHGCQLESPHLL